METHTSTDIPLSERASTESETVCILGTGDFGRALGCKLLQCGYSVVFGSRNPQKSHLLPKEAEVLSPKEAAERSPIVFLAIHRDQYPCLSELSEVLHGRVLVDVSNNLKLNQYQESNAEYLAQLVPGAEVVKAFNTISAWALQSGTLDASRQVFVCGHNSKAKQKVMDIARTLGLTPLDQGSLVAAKEVENYPLQLFPMWRLPMYICTGLTVLIFVYCVVLEVIYNYVKNGEDSSYLLMITIPNRIFPIVSLILLAVVYLAGIFAAVIQLYKGTKYNRFPDWLDKWMLCRKQLGLVALAYAFLHAIYSLVMPIRYYVIWWMDNWVITQIKNNNTIPFNTSYAWRSDGYLALGILGFFFFVLLGITSLPSVSNAVNWREFSFVQSKLGYLTLILCTGHTLVRGWDRFIFGPSYKWYLPPAFVLSLIVPCAVLSLKLILVTPCVDRPLMRIRQGWDRNPKSEKESVLENGNPSSDQYKQSQKAALTDIFKE